MLQRFCRRAVASLFGLYYERWLDGMAVVVLQTLKHRQKLGGMVCKMGKVHL
jgi:hypothetical protein